MLTEKRKADREVMAAQVTACAIKHGATVERSGPDKFSPRRILLNIETPQGLGLYIGFDGDSSQPNTFVVPWCLRSDSGKRLSVNFSRYQGADLGCYRTKCMAIKRGFNQLLDAIDKALEMSVDGTAFEHDPSSDNGKGQQ